MRIRHWLRPPRQLLVVFLAVACVSAGALGWLGWQLLKQDAALEVQRRQEALAAAADRAIATLQRSIAEQQARAIGEPGPGAALASGVSAITIRGETLTVTPPGSLLFYPEASRARATMSEAFVAGERLEFSASDLAGSAREYSRIAQSPDMNARAGALARLARVQRKQQDTNAALSTYDELARIESASVDGMPAPLLARVGRASVFESTGRAAELRAEADILRRDLRDGRWRLVKAEYEFYAKQANEWLGTSTPSDVDAMARTEAARWLWDNRGSLASTPRRAVVLPAGPALAAWQSTAAGVDGIVAGPSYLTGLCAKAVPANLRCALTDVEGHTLTGGAPPTRMVAVRVASASGLPWTLHVFAPDGVAATPSPRRPLLIGTFAIVALVLVAGWYFILRAMSREMRLARFQSDFVAAVSHEFRSPLTSLSHIAQMLAQDRFPSDEMRRKSFAILVRDSDRLRRLVEGLLDFGRFEAGAAMLRLEPLDITALVETTVADFRERVASDGYTVDFTGPGGAAFTRGDREALTRALGNLLDNAVKYSPDCRMVWVEMTRGPDEVRITVRDQGLGIPLHEQREIFDRFVRGADSTARRIKGTGIGLAMVRDIVRAHGGEIQLWSEPGRGSRFTVVLHTAGGAA